MFRGVKLPEGVSGRMLLHSMPGRHESYAVFDQQCRAHQIDLIVCLAPNEEIERKSPDYAKAVSGGALPCERYEFPIQDFSVPSDTAAFGAFVKSVAERIATGSTVLIHCAGGIGRTGTVATCVLQRLGASSDAATKTVKLAGSGPETGEQRGLVQKHYRGMQ